MYDPVGLTGHHRRVAVLLLVAVLLGAEALHKPGVALGQELERKTTEG